MYYICLKYEDGSCEFQFNVNDYETATRLCKEFVYLKPFREANIIDYSLAYVNRVLITYVNGDYKINFI